MTTYPIDSYVQHSDADITPAQALRACAEFVLHCVETGALVPNTQSAEDGILALRGAIHGTERGSVPLTPAQNKVYTWVREFIYKTGHSPSFMEIARGTGLRSKGNVHRHLYEIQQRGWISIDPTRTRSIRIIKEKRND